MTIRADTKVVGKTPVGPSWPLERAALINRHNRNLETAEKRRRQDVAFAKECGREDARRDLAERGMEDADFRRYFFRSMAEALGQSAGESIGEWFKSSVDPVLAERKRIEDTILQTVQLSQHVRSAQISDDMIVETRADFPPQKFRFSQVLPKLPL